MEKLILIGNLGQDPEMKYTPAGQSVATFSVASNRRYKGSDGEARDETTWFRVTVWDKLAEICNEHLSKGQQVYVEGRVKVSEYTDRSGEKRFALEVTASEIQFLGAKPGSGGSDETSSEYRESVGAGVAPSGE